MRLTMKVLLIMLLSACGVEISAGFRLDQPIRLKPGDSATLRDENLSLRFIRVDSDSRCPSDVQCVTAGEASITVEARRLPATAALLSLSLPDGDSADYLDYEVRLLELEPYPLSTETIPPGDYRATLVVSRR